MACSHRFLNELIPDWEIEYLFVGTFNPEWDSPNGNNANYFYGRSTNDFWYILPQAFGGKNLMDKRSQKETLKDFLKNKKIEGPNHRLNARSHCRPRPAWPGDPGRSPAAANRQSQGSWSSGLRS